MANIDTKKILIKLKKILYGVFIKLIKKKIIINIYIYLYIYKVKKIIKIILIEKYQILIKLIIFLKVFSFNK